MEIASISDSTILEIPAGSYSLQVEFIQKTISDSNKVNIQFNKGESSFAILSADDDIQVHGAVDLLAKSATQGLKLNSKNTVENCWFDRHKR